MQIFDSNLSALNLNASNSIDRVTTGRLKQLAISDNGFIFDPQTGQSFTVNCTGRFVLELLKGGATLEEAASSLATECDKPYELTSCCIEAFVMQLNRYL